MTHEQIYPRDTGASSWGDEHTEHLALRAAELGDHDTEALCDEVMAGLSGAQVLVDLVADSPVYSEWMELGVNLGWSTRAP